MVLKKVISKLSPLLLTCLKSLDIVYVIDNYKTPERTEYTPIFTKHLTKGALLKKSLDNIVAMTKPPFEIFDSSYIPIIETTKYYAMELDADSLENFMGISNAENDTFIIGIQDPKKIDVFTREVMAFSTVAHETDHALWRKLIKQEDRNAFFREVLSLKDRYDKIENGVGDLNLQTVTQTTDTYSQIDDILQQHGFTRWSYAAFGEFLRMKPLYDKFYNKFYSRERDDILFGMEAHAILLGIEIGSKIGHIENILKRSNQNAESGEKRITDKENEKRTKESQERLARLDYIPTSLVPLYRGVLHPRYFINN